MMDGSRAPMPSSRAPEPGRAVTPSGQANAERILDAALAVFARYGFAGARIDQIARAAGLSKPNLLYYFRSKEALYLALLTRTLSMWLEPLRGIDADADPAEALAGYITAKLEYARDYPEASRLFAQEIMRGAPILGPVLAGELRALVDAKAALFAGWVAAGRMAEIEPRQLIFMIWATTQHYADFSTQVEALTGASLSDPAFFAGVRRSLLQTFLHGVIGPGVIGRGES